MDRQQRLQGSGWNSDSYCPFEGRVLIEKWKVILWFNLVLAFEKVVKLECGLALLLSLLALLWAKKLMTTTTTAHSCLPYLPFPLYPITTSSIIMGGGSEPLDTKHGQYVLSLACRFNSCKQPRCWILLILYEQLHRRLG